MRLATSVGRLQHQEICQVVGGTGRSASAAAGHLDGSGCAQLKQVVAVETVGGAATPPSNADASAVEQRAIQTPGVRHLASQQWQCHHKHVSTLAGSDSTRECLGAPRFSMSCALRPSKCAVHMKPGAIPASSRGSRHQAPASAGSGACPTLLGRPAPGHLCQAGQSPPA
jgi:hypothetical protein